MMQRHDTTRQRHHEICNRRRAACCAPIRMFAKSGSGARIESRLHPGQRRRAGEGQLHAPHLGHSGDWREANERLDQHGNTFAPSFRVRRWQPQRQIVLRSSRTRSARPCCSSFPPASLPCGFRIGGPGSKRASERNAASGDLSKDKSTVPARFSEDSDLRLQDLGTDQANSGRGNDFRSESRGHPSSNDGAPQQARSGSAVSSRSTNRRDSFVSASAF